MIKINFKNDITNQGDKLSLSYLVDLCPLKYINHINITYIQINIKYINLYIKLYYYERKISQINL